MLAIARGIFSHQLNWTMILIGMAVGVGLIAVDAIMQRTCRVARMPVLAGHRHLPAAHRRRAAGGGRLAGLGAGARAAPPRRAAGQRYDDYADAANRRGVLIASGLIVGESLVGVLMAAIIGASQRAPLPWSARTSASPPSYLGLAVFAFVAVLFWRRVMRLA